MLTKSARDKRCLFIIRNLLVTTCHKAFIKVCLFQTGLFRFARDRRRNDVEFRARLYLRAINSLVIARSVKFAVKVPCRTCVFIRVRDRVCVRLCVRACVCVLYVCVCVCVSLLLRNRLL